jgi:FkbM family methyltransferase
VAARRLHDRFMDALRTDAVACTHGSVAMRISTPNELCRWRAATFSAKEPETIAWIDSIPRESTLWDIGANVGLFSVYAAKRGVARVVAIEPSIFNLPELARNIEINGLHESIRVVPLPLFAVSGPGMLHMSTTAIGGALSTFQERFGFDGKPLDCKFSYPTVGVSADDLVEKLGVPRPDYLKIDVDGIEHLVLAGASRLLSAVRGVLIEVNMDFTAQARDVERALANSGLQKREAHPASDVAMGSGTALRIENQIWTRPQ